MDDLSILKRALSREKLPRPAWQYFEVGASVGDVHRLLTAELITVAVKSNNLHPTTLYRISDKGKSVIEAESDETPTVSSGAVMDAFGLIVGFGDIKKAIAEAIGARQKINFLLEGPPACAKSLFLEGVRSIVPKNCLVFGSRTSASGLSDLLFEKQPVILLMDEVDKMRMDTLSVLLGLMETGEIIETKSKKTRGVKLQTSVIGACNGSTKMPREFLSRFALHIKFPEYTRSQFIEVCRGFLPRLEDCPVEIAEMIGAEVYDARLGDVRKARGICQLMHGVYTEAKVHEVIEFQQKYAPSSGIQVKRTMAMTRMF